MDPNQTVSPQNNLINQTPTPPTTWQGDQTQSSPSPIQNQTFLSSNPPQEIISITQTPTQTENSQIPQPTPKKTGFLKTFLIVIGLVLFGILVGLATARFLPLTITTSQPSLTPTPTIEEIPTPTTEEPPTASPAANISETAI